MPNERSPRAPNRDRDRSVPDTAYTLDELCALAGVTVRTVRYYIGEGLLPPPTGRGAATRYTEHHFDRLLVIGAMKERYLPLREIRRTLDTMSARDIAETAGLVRQQAESTTADAIAEEPTPYADEPATPARAVAMRMPPERSSAADYIANVLDRDQRSRGPAIRFPPQAPEPDPAETTWRRVPITAGAELLIEEATYERRREQIDSLVAWAQRILTGT